MSNEHYLKGTQFYGLLCVGVGIDLLTVHQEVSGFISTTVTSCFPRQWDPDTVTDVFT